MASRIDVSGLACAALLLACTPTENADDTGDDSNGTPATSDDSNGTPATTGDSNGTPATAGYSTGDEPPAANECTIDEVARAGFSLDLGDWPVAGDTIDVDAACDVVAGPPAIQLSCRDDADAPHTIALTIDAESTFMVPALAGAVRLSVVRTAGAEPDTGVWAIRGADDALLLAGNHGNFSHPGDDAGFFAPLGLTVDDGVCEEAFIDNCFTEQRLVLAVDDGTATQRVAHGQSALLAAGYRLHVERAAMTNAYEDPKSCPVDAATPRVFRFLIAREP